MRSLATSAVLNLTSASHPSDRVLRYPDGAVRTIRYPDEAQSSASASTSSTQDSGEYNDFIICGDRDSGCVIISSYETERTLPGAAPVGDLWADEDPPAVGQSGGGSSAERQLTGDRAATSLPSSPAALLQLLRSDAYKEQQAELAARIAGSFQILDGCPWPTPRPAFLLSLRRADADTSTTYTLPTTTQQVGAASEMAEILGDPRLSSVLSMDFRTDGIVAFDAPAQAEAFRDMLEADGHLHVSVVQVDSHELFRARTASKALVVLLGQGDFTPTPAQLAGALRGKLSFDEL